MTNRWIDSQLTCYFNEQLIQAITRKENCIPHTSIHITLESARLFVELQFRVYAIFEEVVEFLRVLRSKGGQHLLRLVDALLFQVTERLAYVSASWRSGCLLTAVQQVGAVNLAAEARHALNTNTQQIISYKDLNYKYYHALYLQSLPYRRYRIKIKQTYGSKMPSQICNVCRYMLLDEGIPAWNWDTTFLTSLPHLIIILTLAGSSSMGGLCMKGEMRGSGENTKGLNTERWGLGVPVNQWQGTAEALPANTDTCANNLLHQIFINPKQNLSQCKFVELIIIIYCMPTIKYELSRRIVDDWSYYVYLLDRRRWLIVWRFLTCVAITYLTTCGGVVVIDRPADAGRFVPQHNEHVT